MQPIKMIHFLIAETRKSNCHTGSEIFKRKKNKKRVKALSHVKALFTGGEGHKPFITVMV